MPKKDINQLAKFLVDQATGEAAPQETKKNAAAAALGKLGGTARAAKFAGQCHHFRINFNRHLV
jgi:hypothetical protein